MKNSHLAAIAAIQMLCAAQGQAATTPFESLSSPAAWEVRGAPLPLSDANGYIAVGLAPAPGQTESDIVLHEPLRMEPGQEIYFDAALDIISPILMNVLAHDADGVRYVFFTESYSTIQQGNFLGGHFRGGLDELGLVRVRAPGMQTLARESFRAIDADRNRKPVLPLFFEGINIVRKEGLEQDATFFAGNFRVSDASFRNEPFYYSFKDAQFFGGPDGAPQIRPTDFGRIYGDRHILDWEIRGAYDGQPFLCGTKSYEFAQDDPRPFKLRFAEALSLPSLPAGTYWVRAKLRSNFDGDIPRIIRELEFRYDVFRNDAPGLSPDSAITADDRIGTSRIRIAPEHDGFTWGPKEDWRTTVRFYGGAGATARIRVASSAGAELLAIDRPLEGDVETIEVDLSSIPPCACTVTASIEAANGATLDSLSRLVGKKSRPADSGAWRLSHGVVDWRDIRDGPQQLVLFCPMINDPAHAVAHYARLFDEMVASGDSRFAEIQTSWNECEPLPGIYDFSVIDGVLEEAARRDIKCFVTFAPLAPPEWVPSHFTQSADGFRFGHTMYLFHGGRFNLFQDPEGRKAALDYLEALVLHTRNNPALLGYFYIAEHSGEAPWAEWFEGFDQATLANFREAMRRRYRRIARANEAWGTEFESFDSMMPPAVSEESSMAFRRDWLVFRREGIYSFMLDSAKTIRRHDSNRIIMVYLDGMINTRIPELARYGVISANGGCAVPENVFLQGAYAEAGIPQRAEEISCTQWSWIPFQLDRSLFNMMGGGGANGHWKMFIPQDAEFASLRHEPNSLDRFESFMPLWRELREAKPVFGDIRIWSGFEGHLVQRRTVNCPGLECEGWEARAFLDSQLPLGMNATPAWKQAKCVLVTPNQTILSAEEAEDLAGFARKGGTLFLTADTGRRIIEREGEDWCLLRDLGFPAPESETPDLRCDLVAAEGSPWADCGRGDFRVNVRTFFEPPDDAGETLLVRDGGDTPGLTRKPFGKGMVYVLWHNIPIPYGEAGREHSESFFREIARDAGAEVPVETSTRLLWTILLNKADKVFYLLVTSRDSAAGTLRVSLPDGGYAVSEAITGKTLPDTDAASLATAGIETSLSHNEVQVWRFTKK